MRSAGPFFASCFVILQPMGADPRLIRGAQDLFLPVFDDELAARRGFLVDGPRPGIGAFINEGSGLDDTRHLRT
jgi:hypothetical protein